MAATGGEFARLAGKYLRKQAKALRRELAGARARDDAEPIHQVRVAARRLRVGLDLFAECLPAKKVKRWKKAARRLLKALGPARDRDVQIAFVRGFADNLQRKPHRPGVARLVLRLEQERDGLQDRVVKAADRFEAAGVVEEVLATAPKTPLRAAGRAESPCETALRRSGPQIQRRLKKLLALEPSLENPNHVEQHHAMRIATKRLRYVLEACQPACGRRIARYVSAAKKLQTLLGDIHDCDVWGEQLAAFLKDEEARTARYFGHARPMGRLRPGLEQLREDRLACRRRLFARLQTVWRRFRREGLWEDLERAARAAGASSPEPAADAAAPGEAADAAASGEAAAPVADAAGGAEEGSRHAPAAA